MDSRLLVALSLCSSGVAARADDLGEALSVVEDSFGERATAGLAGASPRDDHRTIGLLVSRDVRPGRPLESYDCLTESIIDGKNTLRTNGFDRWADRACHELRFAAGQPPPGYRTLGERRLRAPELEALVVAAAAEFDVPAVVLDAIVRFESGGWPGAIGDDGALGLMQLRPEVVASHPTVDVLDARTNLRVGARHLRALWTRFDDLELALAAFRSGEARVAELGEVPHRERRTLWFVREVRRLYRASIADFPAKQGVEDITFVWSWLDDRDGRAQAMGSPARRNAHSYRNGLPRSTAD